MTNKHKYTVDDLEERADDRNGGGRITIRRYSEDWSRTHTPNGKRWCAGMYDPNEDVDAGNPNTYGARRKGYGHTIDDAVEDLCQNQE